MTCDIFDILGITQVMESLKEKIGLKPKYIQQPLEQRKFIYRPQTFDEFISQDKAKDKIELTLEICKNIKPQHFLLMGNAGHGKTTLAGIIANSLGFNFNVYVGSSFDIDTMVDFMAKNQDSKRPSILFIDELAEVDKKTLTFMLPIIEDFKFRNLQLRRFVFIGATTDTWVISKRCAPFLDRIQCKVYLEDYTADDIKKLLVQYNDQMYKANIAPEIYDVVSRNVRYTPRLALTFWDYLMACKDIDRVLKMNRIIRDGLDDVDVRILRHLNETGGRPVGEEALSIIANMNRSEYKELREPYLMRQGLISRGARGRLILKKGQEFLQGLKNE